jgi:ABC-type transport system substrate-binding protein
VRQAFCYAVDWQAIAKAVGGMNYTNQWAIPGKWSYNNSVVGYPYNPDKAKQLLADAGDANGVTIECPVVQAYQTTATMIQQYLSKVGITLDIQIIDSAREAEISGTGGNWSGVMVSAGRSDVETGSIYSRTFTDSGVRYVGGTLHPDDLVAAINNALSAKTSADQAKYCQEASKLMIDKYCLIAPYGTSITYEYEKPYVSGTGLCQTVLDQWTPETANITK